MNTSPPTSAAPERQSLPLSLRAIGEATAGSSQLLLQRRNKRHGSKRRSSDENNTDSGDGENQRTRGIHRGGRGLRVHPMGSGMKKGGPENVPQRREERARQNGRRSGNVDGSSRSVSSMKKTPSQKMNPFVFPRGSPASATCAFERHDRVAASLSASDSAIAHGGSGRVSAAGGSALSV